MTYLSVSVHVHVLDHVLDLCLGGVLAQTLHGTGEDLPRDHPLTLLVEHCERLRVLIQHSLTATCKTRLGDNSSQATIRHKFQKATIRPKRQFVTNSKKRQFVPSDNSSQIPKSDNSSQASIRPILKRRQFVPFVKSDNSSQIV